MLTDQEIINRLEFYCDRLEDDLGTPLHRRHLLEATARSVGDDPELTEIRHHQRGQRHVGALAAAIVLGVVGIGALAVLQSRRADDRPSRSITPASVESSEAATSTVAASTSTTLESPATVPTSHIVRPMVDANLCSPLTATGGTGNGSTFDLHLFAWPTAASSFPIQIIGDPTLGPTGPFALLQRYPDQLHLGDRTDLTINDWNVALSVAANGNGTAKWDLPDGGQGYMRSRGLDRDALIGIISSLTARDPSAAIPGFDYSSVSPTLQLLAEHLNTNVYGRAATYECHVPASGFIYRISSLDGDAVFQYALVIDRPVPLEVGYQQSTLIVIGGISDPGAPTVKGVFDADPTTWKNLLDHPAS